MAMRATTFRCCCDFSAAVVWTFGDLLSHADVRPVTLKRRACFKRAFATHPDLGVRSELAELVHKLGDLLPRMQILKVEVQELLAHIDDPTTWDLLQALDTRRDEIKGWKKHLRTILRDGAALLQFHAACILADATPKVVAALRRLPDFAGDDTFLPCTEAFAKAAASLPVDLTLEIAASVLLDPGSRSISDALDVCRSLLIAILQPQASYTGCSMSSEPDYIEVIYEPRRPYPGLRILSASQHCRLCAMLADCEILWTDQWRGNTREVRTNLWSLFRLPRTRKGMRRQGSC